MVSLTVNTPAPLFFSTSVRLSEPLDLTTAQTAANYQISGGVTVTSATLSAPPGNPGDNVVILVTSTQTAGQTYTLTVSGVKDQGSPGNAVATGSTVQFSAWTLAQGYLAFEHYDAITGAADADITKGLADPRVVAGTPTTAGHIVGRFNSRTIFPDDTHEQYMARITGFLTPTETDDSQPGCATRDFPIGAASMTSTTSSNHPSTAS